MTTARDLRSLRPSRSTMLLGLLAGILGFAVAVQVRSRQDAAVFPAARQEDLVRILDDLNSREDRLRLDIDSLERTRDGLTGVVGQEAAALTEARRRAEVLGILAGTLRAEGPGLRLTIADPAGSVTAEVLLDTIQELRDAGAEAMMLNDVRIVASSFVVRSGRGVSVDGTTIAAPYRFVVVGEAQTLAEAMGIPGGVVDVVNSLADAGVVVDPRPKVVVTALRTIRTPVYARPSEPG
ncbi:MAG TPA: DUF881 domain-containing protein [Mycobacteriales bacterium]|nr:DUF881 domain-containing protein [Mycobacteriales bacterium]